MQDRSGEAVDVGAGVMRSWRSSSDTPSCMQHRYSCSKDQRKGYELRAVLGRHQEEWRDDSRQAEHQNQVRASHSARQDSGCRRR